MWGTDFPHSVGSFPHSQEFLDKAFAGKDDLRRKVTLENPAELLRPRPRRRPHRNAGVIAHWAACMARHPFHDVAIVGVYNTEQARVARGPRLALDHARGRARRARRRRADAARRRRRRRRHAAATSSTRPASGRCGGRCRSSASRRCSRPPARSRPGCATTVLIGAGSAGVYTERRVDRAVDPAGERVRRVLRHVHRGRVRAHRPPPHAHVRHEARGAGDGRRHDPQQRPRQPRGRLLRARARSRPRTSSTAAWSPTRSTSSTAR